MTSTLRRLDEDMPRDHQEATLRSIDETKDSVRKAIEEATKETPRFAQTLTDLRNETHDATREIVETYLESQKEIIISIQSSWSDAAERYGYWKGANVQWNYWWPPAMGMMSPIGFASLYARMMAQLAANFAIAARIVDNMTFVAIEAARATTKYARDHSREMSRMVSINAKVMSHTTREAIRVEDETSTASGTIRQLSTTGDDRTTARGEVSGGPKRK
jgi:hypothetical protein